MPPHAVLLVDDDDALVRYAASYLDRLGYPVDSCVTAAEALAAAAGRDLAVIDYSLAGQTGSDLSATLLSAHPTLRVILWSGFSCDVSELSRRFPGRIEFLMKPFTPRMLQETVERLIGPPA